MPQHYEGFGEGFGTVTNPDGTPWYPASATPGTQEFEQLLRQARGGQAPVNTQRGDIMNRLRSPQGLGAVAKTARGGTELPILPKPLKVSQTKKALKSPQQRLTEALKGFSDKLIKIISR